jgi:N-acylneuraminate cytidylyltransferase
MKDAIFIPARAGSVGVKGKNKKKLGGRPLIQHSVDFAKGLGSSYDIIISTDDSDIFNSYKIDEQVILDELRPAELSSSDVETKEVILFELNKLNQNYKNIWLFQPTCPFRSFDTFFKCKEFLESGFTSVLTVKSVEGDHPLRMKRLVGNCLINYVDTGKESMAPRQSLPPVYLRSGGIYGINMDTFLKTRELVSENCAGVIVGDLEVINIDSYLDFKLAELLLSEV